MYITPKSKNSIDSKFHKIKEKQKDKEKQKNTFAQKLFGQKKYIKIISTKNEKGSNNDDDIKNNKNKVILRNKSNLEHSMKLLSEDNSFKKGEHLLQKIKNFLNCPSAIYTQKHSKNKSFSNIHNKSKNGTRNLNLKQTNLTCNESKLNILFLKNKNIATNKQGNKIFKFPISSKNKKLNNEINPEINCEINSKNNINHSSNNNKMIKTFINYKKPEICFKNLSNNSSINIFKRNNKLKNDMKLNSLNNFNNKNLGAYLKKLYYNNSCKNLNENNSESNRNNSNNNNFILINHLLLNGINITGNNNGNIINKNTENPKQKEKLSRNDKCMLKKEEKEGIYSSDNDKNYNLIFDNYLNLIKNNINFENLDIKRKINHKCKNEENISPEEIHFNTIEYFQKVKILKYNSK